MIRFLLKIIGKILGIVILWIIISIPIGVVYGLKGKEPSEDARRYTVVVWVTAAVVSGIIEMPFEDGPDDGCENLKELSEKRIEEVKQTYKETEVEPKN